MNKQSHFEPKALHASSAFDARPPIGKTRRGASSGRKYPFHPLISYVFTFPEHLDRFLQGGGPSCTGLTTSRKSSWGRFEQVGAAQRSVQMAPTHCRHVKETWMNKQSHFEPKATLRAASSFDVRHPFAALEGVLPVVGPLLSPHFLCLHVS